MEQVKVALNAGELSDELAGRIDLQKVQMGCEVAENVRVLRVGGLTRRAGFKYATPVEDETKKSRLHGFRFSGDQGYVLEFGNNTLRVLYNGALVASGGVPIELATPWTSAQVFALQFAQRVDTIIVTHPEVEPQIITRVAHDNWTIATFPWQERVWELATDQVIQLTPGAKTGNTTLTASAAFFTNDQNWVGTRIRLGHVRSEIPYRRTLEYATTGATAFNASTTSYAVGAKIYISSSGYSRSSGAYAGLAPLGETSFFTCIAAYDHTTDYTGSNNPDDYPTFFRQGTIMVEPTLIEGQWEFETFGTWKGIYSIERSFNGGTTWTSVRVLSSSDDKNYLVQATEDTPGGALYRAVLLDRNGADYRERYNFTVFSFTVYGYGVITARNSDTSVNITVEKDFESTGATTDWYEDAFNPRNGYPRTCTFHQKRLFFGGSDARPQTVWASRTRQPYNFSMGTLADDALSFEMEATEYESVMWLTSHLSLIVGTTGGIWSISSPDGLSITPESNAVSRQVRHGVEPGFPGLPLQNNVLFLQIKGRKVMELTGGSVEYAGYLNADLTQLASHITRGGVTQITTGEVPDSTLYMVSGGQIAVLTYERAQNVVGWTRWVTDGEFESLATCPGGGEDDDVYVVVKRGSRRFIERLDPDMLRHEEESEVDQLNFLDCSATVLLDPANTTVTGLDHLEGLEVEAFTDGESQGMFTVTDGGIELIRAASVVTVGLPYTTLVRTMPLDQGTIGLKSSLSEATLRFRNTLGGEISQDGVNWTQLKPLMPRIVANEPFPLASGDVAMNLHSTWQRKPTISIRQTSPLPMTILAVRVRGKTSN